MLLSAGTILAIAACDDTTVKVDKVNVNVSEALTPERTDSVTVTIDAEYPVSGIADSIRSSICEIITETAFGSDYSGLGVKEAADKYASDFLAEYRSTSMELMEDLRKEGLLEEDTAPVFNWATEINGYFSGRYKDVISYTVNSYVYEGGAHGSSAETSVNIDLKTGKQVTEEDFFIPGYKESLSALLSSHLRDAMPDQDSYEALFVKDIEPNGNFKVSEDSLTYIYGQYEIGPYYLGIVKVNIPWDELGDLVRNHPVE